MHTIEWFRQKNYRLLYFMNVEIRDIMKTILEKAFFIYPTESRNVGFFCRYISMGGPMASVAHTCPTRQG
jgi:hypothetical protein